MPGEMTADELVGMLQGIINGVGADGGGAGDEPAPEEVRLAARLMGLASDVNAHANRDSGATVPWTEEESKKCAGDIARFGVTLLEESVRFHKKFCEALDPSDFRLLRLRRAVSSTLPTLLKLALQNTEETVSCAALFCLCEMRSVLLDTTITGLRDPLGLGVLRADLGEDSTILELASLVNLPVPAGYRPTEKEDPAADLAYCRRALATSLLASALRDQDVSTWAGPGPLVLVKGVVARLRAAVPHLQRKDDQERAGVTPSRSRRSPRKPSGVDSPAAARARSPLLPAAPTSPTSTPAGRELRVQIRRRATSPRGVRTPLPARASAAAADDHTPRQGTGSTRGGRAQRASGGRGRSTSGAGAAGAGSAAKRRRSSPSPEPARGRPDEPLPLLSCGVLFPHGNYATRELPTNLPVRIYELERVALIQLLCCLASTPECLAPVLQYNTVEALIELMGTRSELFSFTAVQSPPPHSLLAFTALSILSVHKKFALSLAEHRGVEVVHSAISRAVADKKPAEAYFAGAILSQMCHHPSVMERLCAATSVGGDAEAVVAPLLESCAHLLRWESSELRRVSGSALQNLLQTPTVLYAFERLPGGGSGLPLLVTALQECLQEAEDTDTADAKHSCLFLGHAFDSFLRSHLLCDTASLWPSSRRLGRGILRAVHRRLPCDAVSSVLRHLELSVETLHTKPHGPDHRGAAAAGEGLGRGANGCSLLTRERFRAAVRMQEAGGVELCLRLLIATRQWMLPNSTEVALDVLGVLAAVPWLRLQIARYSYDGVGSLAVLLTLCTGEDYIHEGLSVPHQVISKSLSVLRTLMTPADVDDQSSADQSVIWQLFRRDDGVRVMLHVLRTGGGTWSVSPTGQAVGHNPLGDRNRQLVCRTLLAMTRQPVLKQMLQRLQVPQLLSDLQQGAHSGPGREDYELFLRDSKELCRALTVREGAAEADELPDVSDHAVRRMERMAVVNRANYQYSQKELASVVGDWLERAGLHKSANMVRDEAKIRQPSGSGTGRDTARQPLHKLETLVTGFLRQQHGECPRAVGLLPRFSLRKGAQPALRAARHQVVSAGMNNVAVRQFQNRLGIGHRCRGVPSRQLDRRLVHSRYRGFTLATAESVTDIGSVGFIKDGETVVVGGSSGSLVSYGARPPHHSTSDDIYDGEPITGVETSLLCPLVQLWSQEKVTVRHEDSMMHVKLEMQACAGRFSRVNEAIIVSTPASHNGAALWDLSTGICVQELADDGRSEENPFNVACLNADDSMVLSNAVLWDLRQGNRPVHRFDKLEAYSRGVFAPSQNEIVIDKEVWDLRSFRLLLTVPALASTVPIVAPSGEIIYGVSHKFAQDGSGVTGGETFSVVDARNYSHIHTQQQAGASIRAMSVDPNGSRIALALGFGAASEGGAGAVRVFEVGRSRQFDMEDDDDEEELGDDDFSESGPGTSDPDSSTMGEEHSDGAEFDGVDLEGEESEGDELDSEEIEEGEE
eukprot:Hpha_TRINITY_DN5184_c0_g1::TRINITY_DN5184_c0_g1_i1::g.192959::m.192959/K11789/VPRBP, DCAF1; HIV-1 Vpr-binding protein